MVNVGPYIISEEGEVEGSVHFSENGRFDSKGFFDVITFYSREDLLDQTDAKGFGSQEDIWNANSSMRMIKGNLLYGFLDKAKKLKLFFDKKKATEAYKKISESLDEAYLEGKRVIIKPTSPGIRNSYPAANWLTRNMKVKLLEPANKGSLDVIDVELEDGTIESIYGFNIV